MKAERENRLPSGLVTALLVVLIALLGTACSGDAKTDSAIGKADSPVTVRLSLRTKGISSDSDSSYKTSYTTYSYDELYWTYTAVKADEYFITGQSTFDDDGNPVEEYLNTDDDGWAAGLPSTMPGKYSLGVWIFSFNAYSDNEKGTQVYSGIEEKLTVTSSGTNTITVNVQLVEAIGDTGILVLHDISLLRSAGSTDTITGSHAVVITATDSDGTETVSDAMLYTADGSGSFTVSTSSTEDNAAVYDIEGVDEECDDFAVSLGTGYYTVTIEVYEYDGESIGDEALLSVDVEKVLIKPNLYTVLTGYVSDEGVDVMIDTTDGINVLYSAATVSSTDTLVSALTDSDISVVTLSSDMTLTTSDYLFVYGTKTIDLNGNTISNISNSYNYGLLLQEGSDVTITGEGTIETMFPVRINGDDVTLVIEDGTYTSTTTSYGSYYVVYIPASVTGADVTINGGTFTADDYIGLYAGSGTVTINGGTFDGAYNLYIDNNSVSPTLNINGGTFNGSGFAFTVNGLATSDNDVTVNITDGDFNGLVYIAGYANTTISGGSFYSSDGQALHMRSGSLKITGGEFKGTHPDEGYAYEYIYAGGGSSNQYGDIVIEASYGYPILSIVVAEDTNGSISLQDGDNYGIHYYLDPRYSYDAPTITVDEDLSYTAHTGLVYRRQVTTTYTSWYLYYSSLEDASATSFTVNINGTDTELSLGDLYVYDSDSGWVAYTAE